MIDRETMLEIAKASGIKFGAAQFARGVLEAEISEFDLEAYTAAVAHKAAEAEREACAQVAMLVASNGIETSAAIRARGTGGAG